jgi:hypothetical protein
MSWNPDISQAPRGKYVTTVKRRGPAIDAVEFGVTRFVPDRVILATKCGKVTLSHYMPSEGRWMMLAKGEEPVAWQPWPEHPEVPR